MGVPQEILAVPRPTNTVVQDLGGNGLRRYAVLERKGIVHTEDGRRYPSNGRVIGHIIDGKFIAKKSNAGSNGETMLSYAIPSLVKDQLEDVQSELHQFYSAKDVYSIMALVAIRVKCPGIACRTVGSVYRSSYASRYWHGAAVSKNALSSLLERLGMDVAKRRRFFRKHVESMAKDGNFIIDGTLKQDISTIDDVTGYSYKTRIRETQDISMLYAFCVEKNEPACVEIFPSNCSDISVVSSFVEHSGITSGIIFASKDTPESKLLDLIREFPALHFLVPLKQDSEYIAKYHLLDFTEVDRSLGKNGVFYKTAKTDNGLFLYSFLDISKAAKEQSDYQERELKNGTYNLGDYCNRRDFFGTNVFLSDTEMNPAMVYSNYMDQWLRELAFDQYKNDLDLDTTKERNNFSLQGNEFVNFLSALATFRILNIMAKTKLLEKMTYGQLIDELDCVRRSSKAPLDVKPTKGDGYWDNDDFGIYDVLEAIGLCQSEPSNKKAKRSGAGQDCADKPKRPVGRPRIHPLQPNAVKRPRGRPKKSTVSADSQS